jgi:hypothetical protein
LDCFLTATILQGFGKPVWLTRQVASYGPILDLLSLRQHVGNHQK